MKLEVGMYVRTEYGISKIEEDRRIKYGLMHPVIDILKKEVIIKASYNIIDLIEVGDYVNGFYVEDVKETFVNIATGSNYFQKPSIFEEDIKSIVTKEMFESMQYKVD